MHFIRVKIQRSFKAPARGFYIQVCWSVCLYVCIQPKNRKKINKTCSEARLAPGSCTVEYKQLTMCTCAQFCSAWPNLRIRRKHRPCRSFLLDFVIFPVKICAAQNSTGTFKGTSDQVCKSRSKDPLSMNKMYKNVNAIAILVLYLSQKK